MIKTHTPGEQRAVRHGSRGLLHPAGNGACAVGTQFAARNTGLMPKASKGAPAAAGGVRSGSRQKAEARAGRACHRAPFRCRLHGPP
jgi:hypothetical protein